MLIAIRYFYSTFWCTFSISNYVVYYKKKECVWGKPFYCVIQVYIHRPYISTNTTCLGCRYPSLRISLLLCINLLLSSSLAFSWHIIVLPVSMKVSYRVEEHDSRPVLCVWQCFSWCLIVVLFLDWNWGEASVLWWVLIINHSLGMSDLVFAMWK